jgi:predicted nucleic acid-binding protein
MPATKPNKLRVFVDADVLIAGAASPSEHSASLVILRMAELTLIEAITSRQAIAECERNLRNKLPDALPAFQLIVKRCLQIVPDPEPAELDTYQDKAHPKDLPILAAAAREGCAWLATFNLRDYQPGIASVNVLEPGDLLVRIRSLLADMDPEDPSAS